jgi:hypothetical protein
LPEWKWFLIYLGCFLLLVTDALRLVHGSASVAARPIVLQGIKTQGGAVGGYLASYLLPFLSTSPERFGEYLAYVAYFLVALLVFIRSDLAMVNPTLYVLGWHIVEVSDRGRRVLLLTREEALEGQQVRVVDFLDVYVVKR